MNCVCTCGQYVAMWSWAGVCWYCGGSPPPARPIQMAQEKRLRECIAAGRRRSEQYRKFAARPNDYMKGYAHALDKETGHQADDAAL
jgi:hypothetical protein